MSENSLVVGKTIKSIDRIGTDLLILCLSEGVQLNVSIDKSGELNVWTIT